MGNPSGVRKHPEGLLRMNFLHKAAEELNGACSIISANFCGQIKQISQKTQVKVHRDIKRKICKGCNALLKAGVTADAKIFRKHKTQKKVGLTCKLCNTRKSFLLAEQRKIDREEKKKKKKEKSEAKEKQ